MADKNWIYEHHDESGTAIGYEIVKPLHTEQSQYQRIDVLATRHFGNVMALDGCWMVTDRDNFIYHEMMVHPAMFCHPEPTHVAVIGGGDCGTLKEVLRHPSVESAIQIELDERVTRVAEMYFPDLTSSNADARAQLKFEDGIKWMENVAEESLDVIIVDSTDPVGPAAGLYSLEFYRTCHAALRRGGILVQQSESPILHLDLLRAMGRRLPRAGFDATRVMHFPQPCYPSGWWSATMARRDGDFEQFRAKAAGSLDTRYYTDKIHTAAAVMPAFMVEAGLNR